MIKPILNGIEKTTKNCLAKLNGVRYQAKALRVKRNGQWVNVWENYNPNLPNVNYSSHTFNVETGGNDPRDRFGPITNLSKLQEAQSKGYTNITFTASVTVNKLYNGEAHIGIGMDSGGTWGKDIYSAYANAGCRGDVIGSKKLTDTITASVSLTSLINSLSRITDKNLYGILVITQDVDYSISSLTVSGYIHNIYFSK